MSARRFELTDFEWSAGGAASLKQTRLSTSSVFARSCLAREELPLGQRGRTAFLERLSIDEVALQAGVIVDVRMHAGELLK